MFLSVFIKKIRREDLNNNEGHLCFWSSEHTHVQLRIFARRWSNTANTMRPGKKFRVYD